MQSCSARLLGADKVVNAVDEAEAGHAAGAQITDEVGIVKRGLPEGRSGHAAALQEGFDFGEECLSVRHD